MYIKMTGGKILKVYLFLDQLPKKCTMLGSSTSKLFCIWMQVPDEIGAFFTRLHIKLRGKYASKELILTRNINYRI